MTFPRTVDRTFPPPHAARADALAEFHDWLARALQGHAVTETGLAHWFDRLEVAK